MVTCLDAWNFDLFEKPRDLCHLHTDFAENIERLSIQGNPKIRSHIDILNPLVTVMGILGHGYFGFDASFVLTNATVVPRALS